MVYCHVGKNFTIIHIQERVKEDCIGNLDSNFWMFDFTIVTVFF